MSDILHGKVVCIVQARLGSSRLPLKSLLSLRDTPIIDWVMRRLAASREIDKIMAAVPDTALDNVLAEHLERHGMDCIAGPEEDVLARFLQAARATDAAYIVRVCADNPLVWGEAVDRLVRHYATTNCDYAYNHIPRDNLWPDGLGAEMLSRELLENLERLARKPSQREHCLNYIWDNRKDFVISTFNPEESWLCRPDLKLDIDSAEDFARMARLAVTPDMDAQAIVAAWDKKGETAFAMRTNTA